MFEVEYKGANTVIISTKKSKLVVDPKLSVVGLKDVSPKGMVAVGTEERFMVANEEGMLAIEGPGDYEVGDFSIRGIPVKRHIDAEGTASTMYRIEVGDVRIAVLGNIAADLSEDQLESLGVIDVVIVPIGGGGYTLDALQATALVRKIDAKVVVPVHYADSGIKYEVPQDDFTLFEKEYGGEVESIEKLKVKSGGSLPQVSTIYKLARN